MVMFVFVPSFFSFSVRGGDREELSSCSLEPRSPMQNRFYGNLFRVLAGFPPFPFLEPPKVAASMGTRELLSFLQGTSSDCLAFLSLSPPTVAARLELLKPIGTNRYARGFFIIIVGCKSGLHPQSIWGVSFKDASKW